MVLCARATTLTPIAPISFPPTMMGLPPGEAVMPSRVRSVRPTPPAPTRSSKLWCAVGVNVGNELDGTGKEHDRPVLVQPPVLTLQRHPAYPAKPIITQPYAALLRCAVLAIDELTSPLQTSRLDLGFV